MLRGPGENNRNDDNRNNNDDHDDHDDHDENPNDNVETEEEIRRHREFRDEVIRSIAQDEPNGNRLAVFHQQEFPPVDMRWLCNCLIQNRHLKSLVLSHCDMGGDDGGLLLVNALRRRTCHNVLRGLDLSGNGLTEAIVMQLATIVPSSLASLIYLDLSYNDIGDDGARALIRAMRRMPPVPDAATMPPRSSSQRNQQQERQNQWRHESGIQVLNLAGNLLTENGVERLYGAQDSARSSLQHLNVQDNRGITDMDQANRWIRLIQAMNQARLRANIPPPTPAATAGLAANGGDGHQDGCGAAYDRMQRIRTVVQNRFAVEEEGHQVEQQAPCLLQIHRAEDVLLWHEFVNAMTEGGCLWRTHSSEVRRAPQQRRNWLFSKPLRSSMAIRKSVRGRQEETLRDYKTGNDLAANPDLRPYLVSSPLCVYLPNPLDNDDNGAQAYVFQDIPLGAPLCNTSLSPRQCRTCHDCRPCVCDAPRQGRRSERFWGAGDHALHNHEEGMRELDMTQRLQVALDIANFLRHWHGHSPRPPNDESSSSHRKSHCSVESPHLWMSWHDGSVKMIDLGLITHDNDDDMGHVACLERHVVGFAMILVELASGHAIHDSPDFATTTLVQERIQQLLQGRHAMATAPQTQPLQRVAHGLLQVAQTCLSDPRRGNFQTVWETLWTL